MSPKVLETIRKTGANCWRQGCKAQDETLQHQAMSLLLGAQKLKGESTSEGVK